MEEVDEFKFLLELYAEILDDMKKIVMRPGSMESLNTQAKWSSKFRREELNKDGKAF